MYKADTIAKFFIHLAERDMIEITHMKLQKLVYFAHGWYLALADEPLIEEFFEAWKYGPILPSLFRRYLIFQSSPIKTKRTEFSNLKHNKLDDFEELDTDIQQFLIVVWNNYKKFDAIELSNLSHAKNSPWEQSYVVDENTGEYLKGLTIDNSIISSYFKNLLKEEVDV